MNTSDTQDENRIPGNSDTGRCGIEISMALSGGGFRATLFHLGAVRRLVELGLFRQIRRISSASGGSILNGLIGLHFKEIRGLEDFDRIITRKIMDIVKINVRNRLLYPLPYFTSRREFCSLMDKHLFEGKHLSDLSGQVKCIFNATDLKHGMRWRFNGTDFGGYEYGYCRSTEEIRISEAVYASAAFPGLLKAYKIPVHRFTFKKKGADGIVSESENTESIQLLDGGIYDNTAITGLQSHLKGEGNHFVIVSDAIETFDRNAKYFNFLNQIKRTGLIILDRKTRVERQALGECFKRKVLPDKTVAQAQLKGVIFLIGRGCDYYGDFKSEELLIPDTRAGIPENTGFPQDVVDRLSNMRTDFDKFHDVEIECLMYHGASLLDTTLRIWHPDIYDSIPHPELQPPVIGRKAALVLMSCHRAFLFGFIRCLYILWQKLKKNPFPRRLSSGRSGI